LGKRILSLSRLLELDDGWNFLCKDTKEGKEIPSVHQFPRVKEKVFLTHHLKHSKAKGNKKYNAFECFRW